VKDELQFDRAQEQTTINEVGQKNCPLFPQPAETPVCLLQGMNIAAIKEKTPS
jgi:hypothetical protein